jgi:hypothetical protein
VYGITAAGVVYSVTEACNMGHLLQCTCDNHKQDITTDGEWVIVIKIEESLNFVVKIKL